MSPKDCDKTHDDRLRSQTAFDSTRKHSIFVNRGEIPTNNSPIKMKIFEGESL